MNKALIDADILSYFLKGNDQVSSKFDLYLKEHSKISISEITYFEILAGLAYKQAKRQIASFEEFVSTCEVLKLSKSSIRISANIYATLRSKGVTIGSPDILIAGIAITNQLTLITNNQKHYRPISELTTSNWNQS